MNQPTTKIVTNATCPDGLADKLHHSFILGLRAGREVAEQAIVAHYSNGSGCAYHIQQALMHFDILAQNAANLRAELARIERAAPQHDQTAGEDVI